MCRILKPTWLWSGSTLQLVAVSVAGACFIREDTRDTGTVEAILMKAPAQNSSILNRLLLNYHRGSRSATSGMATADALAPRACLMSYAVVCYRVASEIDGVQRYRF